jgi:uncharacterized protein (DUF362 family)
MMDSVALVKHEGDLNETLERAIRLIGGLKTLKSTLIVKPNICTGVDETGLANTDVKLVDTFIGLVLKQNRNLSIKIVESDSEAKYADEAFQKFGYRDLEQSLRNSGFDVSLVNLSHSALVPVRLDGLYLKNPDLPSLLAEDKYFVSMAVAKTHGLTFITGTMKNLFGLLPRKGKSYYHPHINEVIVDLNKFVKPDLSIIDARQGLEGWAGPRTRLINRLILGRNPASVDATMARVMGFKPESIPHLVEAERNGIGSLHPNVLGDDPKLAAVKFNKPSRLSPAALVE